MLTDIKEVFTSAGHMSVSPAKGLTVTVVLLVTGRLSVKPPSMYLTPLYLRGIKPTNPGTKPEHSNPCVE